LRDAALALYLERGYDGTTTAEIAARAGVNHRTFFRHFPDKREVLFVGEGDLRDALVTSLLDAPEGLAPIDALLQAFLESAHILEDNKEAGMSRLRLIALTPALQERDLAKGAMLTASLAAALGRRGEPDDVARLAAAVAWTAFHHAATRWISDPARPLSQHLHEAFDVLTQLTGHVPRARHSSARSA
jgi:AcrR family transcriptional regulator